MLDFALLYICHNFCRVDVSGPLKVMDVEMKNWVKESLFGLTAGMVLTLYESVVLPKVPLLTLKHRGNPRLRPFRPCRCEDSHPSIGVEIISSQTKAQNK